jgi:eukaryotic-like serine/threonine-protein kinase
VALSVTLLGGRYELVEPVGAGGFSEVWRATDTVLSRPVAIKLLNASYVHQAEALARFQAEARYAGALAHENIARIYDYAEPADGPPYLVMELVDGPSLATLLRDGPLDAARTMDVVAQAATGLQAAHDAGLIHRDIKPANLLLSPAGTVKITDFGIAHAAGSAPVTATGMLIGTPSYMAPERVAGAQATPASDLYALGIVAYECLAGAPPFSGKPLEVALAHRERPLPPPPLSVPFEVSAFVMQLTAKDAVWRPGSAAEVACRAAALRDGLKAGASGPRPAPPARPARPIRLRHPSALGVVSVVIAGLTCLALAGVLRFGQTAQQAGTPGFTSSGPPQASSSSARHHGGQARTAVRARPAADPAAIPGAGMNEAAVKAGKPDRKQRHAPRRGHGSDHGRETGQGGGSGNGDAPGNGNAQVLGG